jgi:hypothetical protein
MENSLSAAWDNGFQDKFTKCVDAGGRDWRKQARLIFPRGHISANGYRVKTSRLSAFYLHYCTLIRHMQEPDNGARPTGQDEGRIMHSKTDGGPKKKSTNQRWGEEDESFEG